MGSAGRGVPFALEGALGGPSRRGQAGCGTPVQPGAHQLRAWRRKIARLELALSPKDTAYLAVLLNATGDAAAGRTIGRRVGAGYAPSVCLDLAKSRTMANYAIY